MLDRHPGYCAVAISVMCSLVALGPEARGGWPTRYVARSRRRQLGATFVEAQARTARGRAGQVARGQVRMQRSPAQGTQRFCCS